MPLRLQHQITETVGEVISVESRQRFYDISKLMARALRKEIIADKGNSKLKHKTLDLITALRIEDNLLNPNKTGLAPKKP